MTSLFQLSMSVVFTQCKYWGLQKDTNMLLSFQKYSSQGTNMQVNECNKKNIKTRLGTSLSSIFVDESEIC